MSASGQDKAGTAGGPGVTELIKQPGQAGLMQTHTMSHRMSTTHHKSHQ